MCSIGSLLGKLLTCFEDDSSYVSFIAEKSQRNTRRGPQSLLTYEMKLHFSASSAFAHGQTYTRSLQMRHIIWRSKNSSAIKGELSSPYPLSKEMQTCRP